MGRIRNDLLTKVILVILFFLLSGLLISTCNYNKESGVKIEDKLDLLDYYEFADWSDIVDWEEDEAHDLSTAQEWEYLIIHCAANFRPLTGQQLRNIFRSYGWVKPGYNIFVLRDGTSDTLVPFNLDPYITFDEIANGVRGFNTRSIHISYCGGVNAQGRPENTMTPAQRQEITRHIVSIKKAQPHIQVKGHNEFDRLKACPSFNVKEQFSPLCNW